MGADAETQTLEQFHPAVRAWFRRSFSAATAAQRLGWPAIQRGDSTLLLAPTGSGKTLAAFLWCIDRLMFGPVPPPKERCRVLYVSPLKALAVDVDRNLRTPLSAIARIAEETEAAVHRPEVLVRTGDTPARERSRFIRSPTDIVITTPESLFLMLTSQARESLRTIDTVIIDEIHAVVPGKRGAHLALSLERLERLCGRRLQRIGLSATQRPLEEVAHFLGGVSSPAEPAAPAPAIEAPEDDPASVHLSPSNEEGIAFRPVTVVDAGRRKDLSIRVEVPVEDLDPSVDSAPASEADEPDGRRPPPSIWNAIHPRLLELVHEHRTTLIFANSRRLAERLAGALNELAGEVLVLAHHGSLARDQRLAVEEALKKGEVRGIVATSSLELGIDMGAVDLVVQIEAPPSVASALQRIGRAGHQVGGQSRGIIFPKYRGDLVACAALPPAMREGLVEPCRYPRNPLDVLAQQIVAITSVEPWRLDDLFDCVRRAAPYATLGRASFESVLDMLSGRYASDDFAQLRPRLTWDRVAGTVVARQGARRVVIANAGTIPDRGLYGVFLAGAQKRHARVGELDEEMVFESQPGETFVLGASTWRIEEVTHDRVIVSPAPGEAGKMPFWRGDRPGRPLELGKQIGALIRKVSEMPPSAAMERLVQQSALDRVAAKNLVEYLAEQRSAAALPDDRTIVVERCRDELGDWRICLLSPFGGKVHAPWCMAVTARLQRERDIKAESTWTDDGFVIRLPESDEAPESSVFFPESARIESMVVEALSTTALFAGTFREIAGRALLLPRRRPGARAPLWLQRKRASHLLSALSEFPSFPMLLETYRECLRDIFDLPALSEILRGVEERSVAVQTIDTASPSPFARALLFGYVANYLYDGDAPLAERRAQALAIDHLQLRELLGDIELREVLDARVIDELATELQHLHPDFRARNLDGLHDLFLILGDLSGEEAMDRCAREGPPWLEELARQGRIVPLALAGQERYVAVEDVSRYRDALGVALPGGLPPGLLGSVPDPLGDLVRRFARTRGPFTATQVSDRFGLGPEETRRCLGELTRAGKLVEGAFLPGGSGREWCHPDVLATVRRRSGAKARKEVAPTEPAALARMLASWQGVVHRREGPDALLDAIERLQGAALAASVLETEILPARMEGYRPGDLDELAAAGEVVWRGLEPLGHRDGRIALYLTDHFSELVSPDDATALLEGSSPALSTETARERAILEHLLHGGASFFESLHEAAGGGFPGETVEALWRLVWTGLVTNDTFGALRAFLRGPTQTPRALRRAKRVLRPPGGRAFRSRRSVPPSAEGRWVAVASRIGTPSSPTAWSTATAQQLLSRYGLITRQVAQAEGVAGGFSAIYEVLRTLDDTGRVRRGYFVAEVAAMQFASPAALDLLRSRRLRPSPPETVALASSDPANPYGSLLPWPAPALASGTGGPSRAAGTQVILVNGELAGHLSKSGRHLWAWIPEEEPERSATANALANALAALARSGHRDGILIERINGGLARSHDLAGRLSAAGFGSSHRGLALRRERQLTGAPAEVPAAGGDEEESG